MVSWRKPSLEGKEQQMETSHPFVQLARRAIESYVREGERIKPPQELSAEMQKPAGAFVTIRRHGQLRGCIGTIEPVCGNLAEEVIRNAILAATEDHRFPAISRSELPELEVKVDVLSEPEPADNQDDLDPKRYGLIIQSKTHPLRRGLLLPNLDGIDTVEQQVHWTRVHKAGITDPDEAVQMLRFEVKRYT
jgi:AmmeMemoRadiSam system protein A